MTTAMLRLLVALLVALPVTAHAENQFKVRLLTDPPSFDWNIARTDTETAVMMNIMEGLLEFDANMKVRPLLAQSWSVSEDQKTYTFKLRSDVKWSDGKPLTAQDFAYSWRRLLNPSTAASYAYFLFDIEGAEDFNSRKITDFSKVGIKTPDASTIQIRLAHPVAYFTQLLTFWVTFPLRQDVVEKYGNSWSQPGKTVVLGPFNLASYQPQNQILLKRNELYHGKKPMADSVLMRIVSDDSTALNLFRSGQLDYVRPISFLELGEFQGTPAYHTAPYSRTCFVAMNTTKYPFNLPKVRQALAMAIDRSRIGEVVHRELKPATSLLPEAIFPEGKNAALDCNPSAARKLLQEAVPNPDSLKPIEFYTFASDENALLAQYIQDQLQKNLGIKVSIRMPEFATYRAQVDLMSSDLYYRCWAADYADPDTYFSMFLGTSGNNRTGFKNARYDELVRQAAATTKGPDRTRLYSEALNILLKKEAPIAPLYFDSLNYLLNPKIKGFYINSLNYAFYRDIVFSH